MGRLPFDPSRMPPRPPVPAAPRTTGSDPPALSVSQLASLIDRAFRDHLPAGLRVVGEIGQFRERTHWYFDVKDDGGGEGAVVSCVMFASAARKAGFVPEPGMKVLLTGRVEFYAKQGRTSFMVDRAEPIGAGALDLAFKRLCEELRSAGYFDHKRKRPLPPFPRRVAVVTSRTGAALQDVLDTLRRRAPWLIVALADVRVQGDDAASQIARAVRRIGAAHARLGVDLILVTRGGGSMEDLWAFNERIVANAIIHSPIPVVAAIGHETDTTIAELVADLRAATPTQAAVRIAPDGAAIRQQFAQLGARLAAGLRRQAREEAQRLSTGAWTLSSLLRERLQEARAHLETTAGRLERHRPAAVYARREARLRQAEARLRAVMHAAVLSHDLPNVSTRLERAWSINMQHRGTQVEGLARSLDLVGPRSVLQRGFSMTLRADGTPVRSAAEVVPGETLRTRVLDGSFASVVKHGGISEGDALRETAPAGRRTNTRRRSPAQPDRNQLDLFARGE